MNKGFLIALILVPSFLGVAVFGSFGMEHSMASDHGGCVALVARGVPSCMEGVNTLALINFHFDTLKALSAGIVGSLVSLFFLSLVIYATVKVFRALSRELENFQYRFFALQRIFQGSSSVVKIRRWIKSHNNSPSYMCGNQRAC